MGEQIRQLPGQTVVTSHSPEFVEYAGGSLALLRSVGGSNQIATLDTTDGWLRRHPRAVFARCLIVAEGLEGRMLPFFAQALGIHIHGVGIEILDAGGQNSILQIWKALGPRGLGLPIVCIADADVEETLKNFLKSAESTPVPTSPEEIHQALIAHDYFTCDYGECLEQELAQCAGSSIDQGFLDNEEPALQEWRESRRQNQLNESWQKKLGAQAVGDLQDDTTARAYRLSQWKEGPAHVARLMTNDGTDATLIPARFRTALRRAEVQARG